MSYACMHMTIQRPANLDQPLFGRAQLALVADPAARTNVEPVDLTRLYGEDAG